MMKRLIYLLPVLVVLASGCLKTENQGPVITYPAGKFSGEFTKVHRSPGGNVWDTVKVSNLQLVLETGVGYKVLGDTATVHAGSKGIYGINPTNILFQDDTYPKTGKPTKTHLRGEYRYFYDGSSVLQIGGTSGDTLKYKYDLKKVN